MTATHSGEVAATISTTMRYIAEIMAGLEIRNQLTQPHVIAATAASAKDRRR
jgi:hypothetical protein